MSKFVLLAAAALVAAPAMAANLVTNGSFETGNFSGWVQGGNTGFTSVIPALTNVSIPFVPTDGQFQAEFGPVGSVGTLSQTIATVAGRRYAFSFDIGTVVGSPNFYAASFDGVVLDSITNSLTMAYNRRTFTVDATGASSVISFAFRHDPSFYYLDNVTVSEVVAGVPEPTSWAMLIVGFGLTGATMRRRRAAVA